MTEREKKMLADAGLIYMQPESPKNVFVFRLGTFNTRDEVENIRNIVKQQIKDGVVVLPPIMKLEAVTGPCTDVEVIIKQDNAPTEKTIKGLADKICDLINQPYFSKLAKACNIVVCDLCDNADQCKDKPLPPGMQCLGWEPIGGCKK